MSRKSIIAALAAAVAGLAGCGQTYVAGGGSDTSSQPVASDQWGQTTPNPMDSAEQWRSAQPAGARLDATALSPQQFVTEAGSANMLIIQAAQVALSRSTDQRTRDLAQQLIADHRKINDDLAMIARPQHLNVPISLMDAQQQSLAQLIGLSGNEFAGSYRELQLKTQQNLVSLFERASRQVDDQSLKDLADRTLPMLQRHVKSLEQTYD